jgi:hypothetical protein
MTKISMHETHALDNCELETLLIRLHNANSVLQTATSNWAKNYWQQVVAGLEAHLSAMKLLD